MTCTSQSIHRKDSSEYFRSQGGLSFPLYVRDMKNLPLPELISDRCAFLSSKVVGKDLLENWDFVYTFGNFVAREYLNYIAWKDRIILQVIFRVKCQVSCLEMFERFEIVCAVIFSKLKKKTCIIRQCQVPTTFQRQELLLENIFCTKIFNQGRLFENSFKWTSVLKKSIHTSRDCCWNQTKFNCVKYFTVQKVASRE